MLTKPDPSAVLDLIEQHGVTELFLPPTVIYRLLDEPGLEARDLSSLRYFISGAAPLSVDKLRRAIDVFGPVMMQGYGQTEAPAIDRDAAPGGVPRRRRDRRRRSGCPPAGARRRWSGSPSAARTARRCRRARAARSASRATW